MCKSCGNMWIGIGFFCSRYCLPNTCSMCVQLFFVHTKNRNKCVFYVIEWVKQRARENSNTLCDFVYCAMLCVVAIFSFWWEKFTKFSHCTIYSTILCVHCGWCYAAVDIQSLENIRKHCENAESEKKQFNVRNTAQYRWTSIERRTPNKCASSIPTDIKWGLSSD